MITILDLDNCISNDRWRRRFICPQEHAVADKYEAYHHMCTLDSPENLDVIRDSDTIYIFTARPEKYRSKTLSWLAHHDIPVREEHLFMRLDGDHAPSTVIKQAMILQVPINRVRMAYDDKPQVICMYRALGYPATRLAINEDPVNDFYI